MPLDVDGIDDQPAFTARDDQPAWLSCMRWKDIVAGGHAEAFGDLPGGRPSGPSSTSRRKMARRVSRASRRAGGRRQCRGGNDCKNS